MPRVAPRSRVQDFQCIDCVVMTALRADERLCCGKGGRWGRHLDSALAGNPAASIRQTWFDLVCARQWSPQNRSQMQFTETTWPGPIRLYVKVLGEYRSLKSLCNVSPALPDILGKFRRLKLFLYHHLCPQTWWDMIEDWSLKRFVLALFFLKDSCWGTSFYQTLNNSLL